MTVRKKRENVKGVNIKVNDTFTIATDAYNFKLKIKGRSDPYYYGSLKHLLEGILEHSLRRSTATSLKQWGRDLVKAEKDIQKAADEILAIKLKIRR